MSHALHFYQLTLRFGVKTGKRTPVRFLTASITCFPSASCNLVLADKQYQQHSK